MFSEPSLRSHLSLTPSSSSHTSFQISHSSKYPYLFSMYFY